MCTSFTLLIYLFPVFFAGISVNLFFTSGAMDLSRFLHVLCFQYLYLQIVCLKLVLTFLLTGQGDA